MNRLFLIAGIAILIAALAFLNQGIRKASPSDEDLAQQSQQLEQHAEKKASTVPFPQPATPVAPAAASALPAEETVGNPATAKQHIQVGWVYDERNLAKPETLTGALQAVRNFAVGRGDVSVEIADLDVPVQDRSPWASSLTIPGIYVNGHLLSQGNPSAAPPGAILGVLTRALPHP